jgi:serine/threonine-protein phosphatase 5
LSPWAKLGASLGSNVVLEFAGESDSLAMAPAPIGDGEAVTAAWAFDLIRFFQSGGKLGADELCTLFTLAADLLEEESTVATLDSGPGGRWTVIGDLHGSLGDLTAALDKLGKLGSKNGVIFNGDFVDRGFYSVEVRTLSTIMSM